jgi:hypothetical protein
MLGAADTAARKLGDAYQPRWEANQQVGSEEGMREGAQMAAQAQGESAVAGPPAPTMLDQIGSYIMAGGDKAKALWALRNKLVSEAQAGTTSAGAYPEGESRSR